ncbi:MAG: hypothetical protein QOC57_569 [Ilumatobacteraceae bacterium]|nr:hypothetical protein [Ilumatobacteraceae bacterium]
MAHVNTAHRGVRIAAALAAVIIGATACGGQDMKSSATAPPAPVEVPTPRVAPLGGDAGQVASAGTAAPSAAAPSSPASPGTAGLPDPIPQSQYLAIDISFGVEVTDIAKGIDDVVAMSDRHGGQIYERQISIADDRSSTASFVIKLPPKELEGAITDLDAVGTRRTASQGTEDVTAQVVDVDARLVTAQASLDRVRKLLDTATDLGQVLSLESQLTERETLVEQYQAMKRALSERVSLATLRVKLTLSPEPVAKAVVPPKATSKPAIGKAFRTGWNGFIKMLAAILIFIGYTAPFLLVAAAAAAALVPIIRRRNRRQQERRNRSTAPPPPPAPAADPQTSEPDSVGAARSR